MRREYQQVNRAHHINTFLASLPRSVFSLLLPAPQQLVPRLASVHTASQKRAWRRSRAKRRLNSPAASAASVSLRLTKAKYEGSNLQTAAAQLAYASSVLVVALGPLRLRRRSSKLKSKLRFHCRERRGRFCSVMKGRANVRDVGVVHEKELRRFRGHLSMSQRLEPFHTRSMSLHFAIAVEAREGAS